MSDYIKNEDGSFLSEAQIINHMIGTLQDENSQIILASDFQYDPFETEDSKEASIRTGFNPKAYYRITFGRQIRNSFGLWDKNNPYTVIDPTPNAEGIVDHPLHPDQVSARIVNELVCHYRILHASIL